MLLEMPKFLVLKAPPGTDPDPPLRRNRKSSAERRRSGSAQFHFQGPGFQGPWKWNCYIGTNPEFCQMPHAPAPPDAFLVSLNNMTAFRAASPRRRIPAAGSAGRHNPHQGAGLIGQTAFRGAAEIVRQATAGLVKTTFPEKVRTRCY
jgi:hypothetical protein